jgi:hypothetical protein
MITRALIIASALLGFTGAAAAQECLQWGPAELSGFVIEGVYPGPPEFESTAQGDQSLTATLLHLSAPICVAGKSDLAEGPVEATELIQLACDTTGLARGERVTLRGELYPRHTGYHVTPVLLDCAD